MITWQDYEKEVKKRGGQPARDLQRIEKIIRFIILVKTIQSLGLKITLTTNKRFITMIKK